MLFCFLYFFFKYDCYVFPYTKLWRRLQTNNKKDFCNCVKHKDKKVYVHATVREIRIADVAIACQAEE